MGGRRCTGGDLLHARERSEGLQAGNKLSDLLLSRSLLQLEQNQMLNAHLGVRRWQIIELRIFLFRIYSNLLHNTVLNLAECAQGLGV